MPKLTTVDLTRRESQIMAILYRRRRATVEAIRAELPDAPSPSSVRKLLEIMIDRGLLAREYHGPRHVYFPAADARGRQPLRTETAGADFLRQFTRVGDRGAARHVVHGAVGGRLQAFERAAETRPRAGRRAMSTFFADPVIDAAASLLIKATLLLALAAIAQVAMRMRASAAARHAIWTLAIAALLLLPVMSQVLPPWPVIITAAPIQARLQPAPFLRSPQHRWRLG